ncbi:phage portal protein [Agrobacterium tumefaciens]|uniref:phage portal protein n=1 Tax=Agrobacterium tumefaciens TaxID=358 RepID=UPI00080FB9FD|nr:phage portal protein [Agrobacterium tumefaciens]NSL22831.1 phage portal protein [Agrobacterium tumefaciens]NTC56782.1 phage portal protein [Agrobacterium tumefaciens]NTC62564.1 phage portal protein [Agrobacterium tumefaciens]NTC66294.1 phage portal protein [Agrobacterium tumefaciens]NTC74874.1 phage portal protein [Agrobacterium tumefaciens]
MKIWPFTNTEKKALTDEQILEMLGGGVPTATGISVSSETALRVPAVAAAVRTISEAAASLKVKVVEVASDRTETDIPDHPVTALLRDEANEWTSGFEFIRSIVVDALCRDQGGLAWVNRVNGEAREVIRYRPGFINVDYPDDSLAPRYRISGIIKPSADIIHLRGPFDKAPLTLCREAIGVAMVMERHAARLFGQGARPGGVIESEKPLGAEGSKSMITGWRAAMEGSENAGKTAILWDGAKWKAMTLSSVDAQFQQLRLFQLQEIARAFNIPASLLGDMTRATWSNAAEMQRQFLQLCLEPWLRALESALRRALFSKEDRKKYAIRFDRDDFTNVDLTARATAISSLVSSRVINPNTAREWLDLPPYDGGEEYVNPNTGASQPGIGRNGGPKLQDDNQDDTDKERNDDAR